LFKSSRYIEKHVQKEGVAIETQGVTIITNGKRRETLTGNATFHLYPHFSPLRKIDGMSEYLSTELCDSIAKRFQLITFVDTPGLVDGNMQYAFDVNEVITYLGDMSDLIFVFFDPIGQALCRRTMSIVGELGKAHAERMHFFLSKSDEAGDETDRQRVLMQITQEVCKWPSLNRTCFDIQTIYNPNRAKPTRCVNQIEEAAKTIERTIQLTIQNTLNQLETDCENIALTAMKKIQEDEATRAANLRARLRGLLCYLWLMLLPILFCLGAAGQAQYTAILERWVSPSVLQPVLQYASPLAQLYAACPPELHLHMIGGLVALLLLFFVLGKLLGRTQSTLTRRQKKRLNDIDVHVREIVTKKKPQLYEEYLKQSVKDTDF